jgi:tetratricopeptide (TPR) repeat protein
MSSIIEGYNYDIFISYRQKDNKYDGWVTEFVDNLKKELEATFKEEISVYFDINPHDGLLETHDVDESLKDKLRCLIFIPIISRTYCDPKSFAWEHEFKAFVEKASKDQFGLKVKLPNGNVASRVLPIRIHELDRDDIETFESVLGGVLRGVEFIYKEPGVNRPLRANEDRPNDNINKTLYRNQINKVTNAIKEIISGLSEKEHFPGMEKPDSGLPWEVHKKERRNLPNEKQFGSNKSKLISYIVTAVIVLILIGVYAYPKIFSRDTLEKLRSSGERVSIAVMPFQNLTNDTLWNIWQGGVQYLLITSLSNFEELKIRQAESITELLENKGFTDYASITPSVASLISQKLDVSVIIMGSILKEEPKIRINASLIDAKTKEVYKSFTIDGIAENIISLTDSLSAMLQDYLIMSKLLKEDTHEDQKYMPVSISPLAYKIYLEGENAAWDGFYAASEEMFQQAIAIDSNFAYPFIAISWSYYNQGLYEEAKKWCIKACEKKNLMSKPHKIETDVLYASCFETPYEAIGNLRKILELDDQQPVIQGDLGNTHYKLFQYDKAIPSLEKALEIFKKWNVKPPSIAFYTILGTCYHKTGQYRKENKLYKKAEKDFPDAPYLFYKQAILSVNEGDTLAANEYIKKFISLRKENSASDAVITAALAGIYSEAGTVDKAEEYYRLAQSLESNNNDRVNNLAYFLIDKDRNINEGMELIDKVLEVSPENFIYLHTKGWGLYKQSKYQEALDILQKSWNLRRQQAIYDHTAYLHLEAAKKAVTGQKN